MAVSEQLQTIEELFRQGDKETALKEYKNLMVDGQGSYDIWVNYAAFLFRCGQYDDAIMIAKKSLEMQPSAEGFHNIGACYDKMGRFEDSIAAYKKAIEIRPDFIQSHHDLASVYEAVGTLDLAIDHYQIATTLSPATYSYWCRLACARQAAGRFREALTALRFAYATHEDDNKTLALYAALFNESQDFEYDTQLSKELVNCFKSPGINKKHLVGMSRKFVLHPALIESLTAPADLYNAVDYSKITQDAPLNWEGLNAPNFLALLSGQQILEYIYELRLTALRAHCLRHLEQDNSGATLWNNALVFINALACQCFISEYIWTETQEERDIISRLEQRVIKGENLTLYDITIYACYRPLHMLPRAQDLLDKLAEIQIISAMVTMQLAEPLCELTLKQEIKTLTSIDDGISKMVKEQYEENPYPRWISVERAKNQPFEALVQFMFPHLRDDCFSHINSESPRTLIAGCGTGKQPIVTALSDQSYDLLAIDLSASSIAYAQRKTQEMNITNIEYGVADLLKIEELGEQFDFIQCGGVLHHMEDPVAGWRALDNVLKPGGFMIIALYSDVARKSVVAARDFIDKHHYTPDSDGIRACRQAMVALPDSHPAKSVTQWGDFYTMSACRDLIFHVHEQRFGALEIKEIIEGFGSEFLGFNLAEDNCLAEYTKMFPDDPHGLNLENWHVFEQVNPDTFRKMYHFWIQKPY